MVNIINFKLISIRNIEHILNLNDVINMNYYRGIYCYIDKKNDEVVYVGKDSHIDKNCKQEYIWIAYPSVDGKRKWISSVNLDKCIQKVEDFINSEDNTYKYTDYEVK